MRRRHRRLLFNLFAFSLLGVAVYLNMYKMHDGDSPASSTASKHIVKTTPKAGSLATSTASKTTN